MSEDQRALNEQLALVETYTDQAGIKVIRFIMFLVYRELLANYMINIDFLHYDTFTRELEKLNGEFFSVEAFAWSGSNEGSDFWDDLSCEWYEHEIF